MRRLLPWLFGALLALALPARADLPHQLADAAEAAEAADDEIAQAQLPTEVAPPPPAPDPLAGVEVRQAAEHVADLVVIVSVDGLRPDAILPSHHAFATVRRSGAVATDVRTIVRSTTLPSHASMLSGVDDARHGLTWNGWRPERGMIRFPTIFRVARLAGIPTAMFVGKNKLRHIVDPIGGPARFVIGARDCDEVVDLADGFLRSSPTGLAFVHFPDPDGAGHHHGWMSPGYAAAVAHADHCLARVLADLTARPHGPNRVLLIVTADHGGHLRSHGSGLDSDRQIPWMAWGGAAAQATIARPLTTMDTAATALTALGLPLTPTMQGRPVTEALRSDAPLRTPHPRARSR